MRKYDAEKSLKLTKARLEKVCAECGGAIRPGAEYFRETLRLLAKPPGIQLKSYCIGCGKKKELNTGN